MSPFSLANVEQKDSVRVVVDSQLFSDANAHLVYRAFGSYKSIYIPTPVVETFIKNAGFDYKTVDFASLSAPAPSPSSSSTASASNSAKMASNNNNNNNNKSSKTVEDNSGGVLIGITAKKSEDFPAWYTQVLTRTEMMDYYDISGCYIIRPWAYKIWKEIQSMFTPDLLIFFFVFCTNAIQSV